MTPYIFCTKNMDPYSIIRYNEVSSNKIREVLSMQKLNGLSKNEIVTISHQIADAFYDYNITAMMRGWSNI